MYTNLYIMSIFRDDLKNFLSTNYITYSLSGTIRITGLQLTKLRCPYNDAIK